MYPPDVVWRPGYVLCTSLGLRLLYWYLAGTFFVPDEYYQTIEVASSMLKHGARHRYGYTWEWRPEYALRSPLYPIVQALAIKLLRYLVSDMVLGDLDAGRLLQSICNAVTDMLFYLWSRKHCSGKMAWLLRTCLLWFSPYTGHRTLVNNCEEVLFILALYLIDVVKSFKAFHLVNMICIYLRPTGVIGLIPLYANVAPRYFLRTGYDASVNRMILSRIITVGIFSAAFFTATVIMDTWFYGRVTSTIFNFFYVNIWNDLASAFGTHPKHYYVTVCLGQMLNFCYPAFIYGFFQAKNMRFSIIVFVHLAAYSLIGHKEIRFLAQTYPLIIVIAATGVQSLLKCIERAASLWAVLLRIILVACVLANVCANVFLLTQFQSTPFKLVRYLKSNIDPNHDQVLVLMPCYSIPIRSVGLHPDAVHQLSCDPVSDKEDETRKLSGNPGELIRRKLDAYSDHPPRWIVHRNSLSGMVEEALQELSLLDRYQIVHRIVDKYSGIVDESMRGDLIVRRQNISGETSRHK